MIFGTCVVMAFVMTFPTQSTVIGMEEIVAAIQLLKDSARNVHAKQMLQMVVILKLHNSFMTTFDQKIDREWVTEPESVVKKDHNDQ